MVCKIICSGLIVIAMVIPLLLVFDVEGAHSQDPGIFIRLTFNIAWARFCYLAPLFKDRLSDILIEERDGFVFLIPASRIKIINLREECKHKHGNAKTAVVDFYISTHDSPTQVDKKYTEHAFRILHYFFEAKRMVLLAPTFEKMVDKVEIRGREAHKFPKKLNEEERIGIGITVGLTVVFALTLIYYFLYYKGKSSKTMNLKDPEYGVSRRDSLASKETQDIIILDEGMEMEGVSGLKVEGETSKDALETTDQEEEEELNFVRN